MFAEYWTRCDKTCFEIFKLGTYGHNEKLSNGIWTIGELPSNYSHDATECTIMENMHILYMEFDKMECKNVSTNNKQYL